LDAEKRTAEVGHAVRDAAVLELREDADELVEIIALAGEHRAAEERLWARHEPEAHFRHNAEIRLREHPIDSWPEARLVLLPGLRARKGAHSRAHQLPVRQDDLHPAVRIEMVAKLRPRIATAPIERVADETAPAGIGHIH